MQPSGNPGTPQDGAARGCLITPGTAGRAAGVGAGSTEQPTHAGVDLVYRSIRDAASMAAVAEQALHEDARFRAVWIRAASGPAGPDHRGAIEIGGSVADPRLLAVLHTFASEWGGISVDVAVAPAASQDHRHTA
jgi:hypothetical protein